MTFKEIVHPKKQPLPTQTCVTDHMYNICQLVFAS